jgi:hypothetical protein
MPRGIESGGRTRRQTPPPPRGNRSAELTAEALSRVPARSTGIEGKSVAAAAARRSGPRSVEGCHARADLPSAAAPQPRQAGDRLDGVTRIRGKIFARGQHFQGGQTTPSEPIGHAEARMRRSRPPHRPRDRRAGPSPLTRTLALRPPLPIRQPPTAPSEPAHRPRAQKAKDVSRTRQISGKRLQFPSDRQEPGSCYVRDRIVAKRLMMSAGVESQDRVTYETEDWLFRIRSLSDLSEGLGRARVWRGRARCGRRARP